MDYQRFQFVDLQDVSTYQWSQGGLLLTPCNHIP